MCTCIFDKSFKSVFVHTQYFEEVGYTCTAELEMYAESELVKMFVTCGCFANPYRSYFLKSLGFSAIHEVKKCICILRKHCLHQEALFTPVNGTKRGQ